MRKLERWHAHGTGKELFGLYQSGKEIILHDCGDWRRTAREKRFCKHIGVLMLALPEDAATIDWFKGVRFEDKEKNWRASLKAASVRLFLRGDREGLPGWVDASYAGRTLYRVWGDCER
ncbi:MAG: hypothetical protein WA102_10250 [Candidatus Methanoperedens sp.]